MIKIENIKGCLADLIAIEADCKRIGCNVNETLLYGKKEIVDTWVSDGKKRNFKLSYSGKYLRTAKEYHSLLIDNAPYPYYEVFNSGFLSLNSSVSKGCEIKLRYIFDNDTAGGIWVYPWMLWEGSDCCRQLAHENQKRFIFNLERRNGAPLLVFLFRKNSYFPIALGINKDYKITFGKCLVNIAISKNYDVFEGDCLFVSKCNNDPLCLLPINENTEIFLAKRS